jgi:hypothetical protein
MESNMIICFDCKGNNKEILDNLIGNGRYKNYNEIINLAIENLSLLEHAMSDSGGLVIQDNYLQEDSSSDKILSKSLQNKSMESKLGSFSLPRIKENQLEIAIPELPVFIRNTDSEIPVENWLFGQYNRLFPAKVSCRSIANHQQESNNGLDVNDYPMIIAKEALSFAKHLHQIEEKHKLERDDLLTIAFPSIYKDGEKSLLRYSNQFVVSKNSSDELQGLLYDLKLINYSYKDSSEYFSLTKPGWDFATLKNPILEGFQETPSQKFSDEEKSFLITHIKNNVPVERYAYTTIIEEIMEGNNTPEQIDHAIKNRFENLKETNISDSFLSTQRSGAISRMTELGLINRIREGIRVKYEATEVGINQFT